jgi:hypothetical protein
MLHTVCQLLNKILYCLATGGVMRYFDVDVPITAFAATPGLNAGLVQSWYPAEASKLAA